MNLDTDGYVDVEFSNGEGKKPSLSAAAAITALGGVGAALANRQNRPLSEVEQKCGKRPLLIGKKRNEWNDCAKNFASTSTIPIVNQLQNTTSTKKKIPTWAWVVGGVVVTGLIGFLIYKSTKK